MRRLTPFACVAVLAIPATAATQDSDEELAHKLSNPVANLISVPFQGNYDCCTGPDDGARYTLNIQPVVPISLNQDWNVIVRTIVPVIYQERTSPTVGSASGVSDVTQSFFFSPKETKNGIVWAIGPAFLWPTGGSDVGSEKWGAGPTVLVLRQHKRTTVGFLANHIWSYADTGGGDDRQDISTTFVQPFISWTSPKATTVGINSEATYNWKTQAWTIPINLTVSQLYNFGGQRVSLGAGLRGYMAREGSSGPEWGARLIATFLFPG